MNSQGISDQGFKQGWKEFGRELKDLVATKGSLRHTKKKCTW